MKSLWLALVVLAGSAAYAQEPEPSQETIDRLREQLKNPNRYRRLAGMIEIGRLQAKACIPDLDAMLGEEKDPRIQYTAMRILGDLEATEEIPRIRPFLHSRDEALVLAAVAALITLGDKESTGRIVAMVEKPRLARYSELVDIVGSSGLPEAIPVLMKLLDDEKPPTSAIKLLGRMRHAEAGDKILARLKDPSYQGGAIEALGLIDARKYAENIRPFLADPKQRLVAAKALAQVQDPVAYPIVVEGKFHELMNFYSAPKITKKLYDVKIPLRRVRNRTVLQTAQAITELSGVTVEFSTAVGAKIQNAVFAMNTASLGSPSCFTVLSSFNAHYVSSLPGTLEWIATPEGGVRVVTAQEATTFWEGVVINWDELAKDKEEPPAPEKTTEDKEAPPTEK